MNLFTQHGLKYKENGEKPRYYIILNRCLTITLMYYYKQLKYLREKGKDYVTQYAQSLYGKVSVQKHSGNYLKSLTLIQALEYFYGVGKFSLREDEIASLLPDFVKNISFLCNIDEDLIKQILIPNLSDSMHAMTSNEVHDFYYNAGYMQYDMDIGFLVMLFYNHQGSLKDLELALFQSLNLNIASQEQVKIYLEDYSETVRLQWILDLLALLLFDETVFINIFCSMQDIHLQWSKKIDGSYEILTSLEILITTLFVNRSRIAFKDMEKMLARILKFDLELYDVIHHICNVNEDDKKLMLKSQACNYEVMLLQKDQGLQSDIL